MGDNSKIQWTEATWNFIVGCNRVSAECDHCYAIREAARMAGNPNAKIKAVYDGLTTTRNERLDWTGVVRFVEERLDIPLRWQRPRRIFVASLSDPFHHLVRVGDLARAWAVMYLAGWHVFQVLTKRADRMRAILNDPAFERLVRDTARAMIADGYALRAHPAPWQWPLKNVWLGVSVGTQEAASKRIAWLLRTPAQERFLSCEPLLGEVNLDHYLVTDWTRIGDNPAQQLRGNVHYHGPHAISWIIVGGESGPNARPMHPKWERDIRQQAIAAGARYHFKQWGEWIPKTQIADFRRDVGLGGWVVRSEWTPRIQDKPWGCLDIHGTFQEETTTWNGNQEARRDDYEVTVYRVGKNTAGRLVDGQEWNG